MRRDPFGGVFARVAGALFFAAMVAIPAHAALFDDDVARKQIAEQARRVDDLRSQSDAIFGRIGKIEESLRNQPVLELVSQIEALRREIQGLRGQIEVVNNGVESNAKRQRDMYVDLDTRMRRIEQGAGAPAAPGPVVDAGVPASAAPVAGASADEGRVYEAAQQQRRNGNYQGAITSFQSFLGQYPRSPLAHRAQYWIGDSYFNLRDYKNAIASQQKLISTYPDSASAPDALLNIASSQAELGDGANARKTMDTLVARYPSSEAAEKAKRRISTLR
ncbi:MAG: tol-pal system protein YbgF [Burkholderiales bacterium]